MPKEQTMAMPTAINHLIYPNDDHCEKEPLPDRTTTRQVFQALRGGGTSMGTSTSTHIDESGSDGSARRPPIVNVHGNGPLILSDIPPNCRKHQQDGGGVLLGIDEAGRGSVLGPMVYGCAYWSIQDQDTIPKDFNDSKQLREDQRTRLMDAIVETPTIGFATRILHASEISRNMLRSNPYNLNQMSHDAAFEMIRSLLQSGVDIRTCYIDTVGNPQHYQRRLEREFGSGIEFIVESKCDANYAPCSAASVGTCARVLVGKHGSDLSVAHNDHTASL